MEDDLSDVDDWAHPLELGSAVSFSSSAVPSTTFRLIRPDAGRVFLSLVVPSRKTTNQTYPKRSTATTAKRPSDFICGPLGRFNVYVLLCVGVSWPLPVR